MGSYWSGNGRYQADADALGKLVPDFGPAKTGRGELFRAASQIYYDLMNNGWGNEWKGPAMLLINHISLPVDVIDALYEYGAGDAVVRGHQMNTMAAKMERMLDAVIEHVRNLPDEPNPVDMWEYSNSRLEDNFITEEDVEDWTREGSIWR